jgi:hypothetical protein
MDRMKWVKFPCMDFQRLRTHLPQLLWSVGAAAVHFKLNQYVQAATQHVPSLAKKRITPHTWTA